MRVARCACRPEATRGPPSDGYTGIVVPNLDPWLLVLTSAHERVRDKGLLVIEVDYEADHGLRLRAFQLGRLLTELKAESEVGRRASFSAGASPERSSCARA